MQYEIHTLTSNEMPELLRELPDPPKKLYVAGRLPDMKRGTFLTVVGSRMHTLYGKEVCEKLIAGLAGYPVVIVSGLALGIDSVAHRAALRAGLKTVAFPGSGLDKRVLYPAMHAGLAENILKQKGALISEFDPLFRPTPWSFHQRNRLMAGISKAVLVVEAEERSGTLITSRLAVEYNRDVLAVPGSIFSPQSRGANMLIRLGATPIRSSEDILDALDIATQKAHQNRTRREDLSPPEMRVLQILAVPHVRDDIIRALEMRASDANVLLSSMELKGLVEEKLGKFYRV